MSSKDERERQSDRLRQAVERKNQEAQERAEASRVQAEENSLTAADRPQDEFSVRAKGSGHGKKTADKWNQ
jgi:hypothetical protein